MLRPEWYHIPYIVHFIMERVPFGTYPQCGGVIMRVESPGRAERLVVKSSGAEPSSEPGAAAPAEDTSTPTEPQAHIQLYR